MKFENVCIYSYLMVISYSYEHSPENVIAPPAKDELVALAVMWRHGDRPPLSFYPTDPHKDSPIWTAPPGDLSNVGKSQMFELGRWLRQRYDGFLSAAYRKDEIYILSSDDDRCLASASVQLAGLYPPKQEDIWNPALLWQPIPVHTIPGKYDSIINPWGYFLKCSKIMSKLHVLENEENRRLFEYLSTHTGIKKFHFWEGLYVWDALYIEQFNNLTLPEWTKEVYPQKLNQLREDFFSIICSTEEIVKLLVGVLLHQVLQQFDSLTLQQPVKPNEPKVRLYSVHDINLHAILNVLEVPHSSDIPFASSVLVELRRKNTGELYVQLIYKTSGTEILHLENFSSQWSYDNFKKILKQFAMSEEEFLALVSSQQ